MSADAELLATMIRASDGRIDINLDGDALDLLAYDIADIMDRGEYGLGDITQDDIRAILPAFLIAALAHADTNEIHPDRSCSDGGTCHHECRTGACFRVGSCGPLSGVYPGDQWPESVIRAEADNDEVHCDRCGKPGRSLCEDCVTRRAES